MQYATASKSLVRVLNKATTETTPSVARAKAVIFIALPIVPTDVEAVIEPEAVLRAEEGHHTDDKKTVKSPDGEPHRQRVIFGSLGSRIGATFHQFSQKKQMLLKNNRKKRSQKETKKNKLRKTMILNLLNSSSPSIA